MASTTDPAANEAAMKQRILTHMNNDHHASLQAYLQYYNAVPAWQTHDAKLTDITLTYLTISSSVGRRVITLRPPMKSLSESRERMVAMHNEAYRGLGKDPEVTITQFRRPTSALWWFMFVLSAWALQTLSRPGSLYPGGSIFYDKLLEPFAPPPLITYLRVTRIPTLVFLVVTHLGESLYLWKSRLERYSVPRYSAVWWKWMATVIGGGFPGFAEFDAVVEEERRKKKH